MSTRLDTKLVPKTKEIIDKFGKLVTLTRETNTYNPATGDVSSTSTSVSIRVTPPREFPARYIDGSLIQIGDVEIGVPASGLTITPSAVDFTATIDSVVWKCIRATKVYSGDDVVLWRLQLRRVG